MVVQSRSQVSLLNIETMKHMLEKVNTVNVADTDRNIINQVFQDALAKITSKMLTTARKKRNSRGYEGFDELKEPIVVRVPADRNEREITKKRTHNADTSDEQTTCVLSRKDTSDGRYKSKQRVCY